ncbi:MAG: hypothetical protein LUD68_10550 [Rikenellaceae bacterium]|nr:hypothetical protein [Rikenellaceae bacterium]
MTVSFIEDEYDQSYKLTGLRYDIHVQYDAQTNQMTMVNNNFGYPVGTYSEEDYLVRFLLISQTNTFNHTNSTYNMVTQMDFDEHENIRLSWIDGGVWSSIAYSWNFSYYTDAADTGTRANIFFYYGPLTMVKQ